MIKKGNKLYSIFLLKCPHCHEGDLFEQRKGELSLFGIMPAACPVCGQDYVMETGFYFGAMYVSYAVAAAYSLPLFLMLYAGFDVAFWNAIISVGVVHLVLAPYVYRLSRAIWINIFVKYRGEISE